MGALIVLLLLHIVTPSLALGMVRTLKYRSLTEMKDNEICVYTKHERNIKRANQLHPLNTPEPIVCQLQISALASQPGQEPFAVRGKVLQHYDYEVLTKSCSKFSLMPGQKVIEFLGLSYECVTAKAAIRVFPGYVTQLRDSRAQIKHRDKNVDNPKKQAASLNTF